MFKEGQEVQVLVTSNRCNNSSCVNCKHIPKFYEGLAKIFHISEGDFPVYHLLLPDGRTDVISLSSNYKLEFPLDYIKHI